MYPNDQHKQVLMDLSQYVRVIISQRLVRSKEGKRVAAVEVMLNTPHIQEMILKGDISSVKEAFKDTKEPGMQSFDQALFELYRRGGDQHGRGAVERRLALEPRGEDQLQLAGIDFAGVEYGPVDADALHRGAVGGLEQHVAARAAADPASHELLERELARKIELARELRDGR